jgi:hypothetical protein
VKSLNKVTRDYVGKTWKQTIDLALVKDSPIKEVSFTLTAINVTTRAIGNMIAVRALSEPFIVTVDKGPLRCKINSVYLFDNDIDKVYLSISVFEATTDGKDIKEALRHEVATYQTDSSGRPFDLSDVGKDFEALVAKVGLRKDSLQITKKTELPKWAKRKGITVAQAANICAGATCEGALNPVGVVTIPTARSLLGEGLGGTVAGPSVLERLGRGIGWNVPTAVGVGLITWGVVEAADDDDDDKPIISP